MRKSAHTVALFAAKLLANQISSFRVLLLRSTIICWLKPFDHMLLVPR